MIPLGSKSIVLAVLSRGYATGAEIIRRAKSRAAISVHVGSVYPAIAMLEEDGFIRVKKRGSRHQVRGNVYELSAPGRRLYRKEREMVSKLYGFGTMDAADAGVP